MVREVLGVLVLGVLGIPGVLAQGAITAQTAPPSLVGTWMLSRVELIHDDGPSVYPQPRGLLVFDKAAHVFELDATGPRKPYAGNQPTPSEALATLDNYDGFWGSYAINQQNKTLTYQPEGAINPGDAGRDFVRKFELKGDTLVLTSINQEYPLRNRWTWERVPTLDNLTAANRQLLGFWRHVVERRIDDKTGAVLSEQRRAPSVIVYTPSGFVGVHFPPLNRAAFATTLPTEAEAAAAVRGFVSYYGSYTLYPGVVFHHRLIMLSNQPADTLRRFYDITGDQLTLKFPPGGGPPGPGPEGRTNVILKRISGAREMIP